MSPRRARLTTYEPAGPPPTIYMVREAAISWSAPRIQAEKKLTAPIHSAAYLSAALPLGDPREHFAVVALDTRHKVIGHYIVSVGTLDASLVHPREVFRFAVMAGAQAIVLGHTHPSGEVQPSAEDLTLTRRMVAAGDLVGIAIVDHVIVAPCADAGYRFHSLRESSPATFSR